MIRVVWVSLLVATAALASAPPQVEGILFDLDGGPARGYSVLLIDSAGEVAHEAGATDGAYAVRGVRPGRYALALRAPEGMNLRVLAPPVSIAPGTSERRDIRLAPAADEETAEPKKKKEKTYGPLRIWWVGLSKATKAWTVIGIVGGAGTAYWLLESDDEPVSESAPEASR